MTRKLKALGLALVAVFALSAAAASTASAHQFMSEGNAANVTLHGTQETVNRFFVTTGTPPTECEKATFHGTMAASPASTITMHPEYTNCEMFGFSATVDVPVGCNFVFGGATNAENHGTVALNCGMGEPIKHTVPGCTIEFGDTHPANTPVNQAMNGVSYTNIGAGATREVTVTWTVHNIVTNAVGPGCALGGISTGTHTTGVYEGKMNITGSVSGAHVGVTIE